MNELSDFFKKLDRLEKVYKTMPRTAGIIAINFTKERFRAQNWINYSTEPWAKRRESRRQKRKNAGRNLLVKTGRLRRSPRIVRMGSDYVIIGSDVPYAKVHNQGFSGTVTIPAHARKIYQEHKEKTGTFSIKTRRENTRTVRKVGGTVQVKSFTKKLKIPRRQFLGPSIVVERQIQRQITADIIKAIK